MHCCILQYYVQVGRIKKVGVNVNRRHASNIGSFFFGWVYLLQYFDQ